MSIVEIYMQEAAKFALFAQQAKFAYASNAVDAAKEALELTKKEHSTFLEGKKNVLINAAQQIEVELESIVIKYCGLEEKYIVDLKNAEASKSFPDLIAAHKLGVELSALKQELALKSVAMYEKFEQAADLQNPEADKKLADALKLFDDTSIALADFKKDLDLAQSKFEKDWPSPSDLDLDPVTVQKLTNELDQAKTTIKKSVLDLLTSQAVVDETKQQTHKGVELANNVHEFNATIEKLTLDFQKEKESRVKAENNLKKAEFVNHSNEVEKVQSRKTMTRLSDELNSTKLKSNNLIIEINTVQNELTDTRNKLTEIQHNLHEAQDSLVEADMEIHELNYDKDGLIEDLKGARATREDLHFLIDDLQSKLKDAATSTTFNESNIEVTKLTTELENMKKENLDLANELEDAKVTINKERSGSTTSSNDANLPPHLRSYSVTSSNNSAVPPHLRSASNASSNSIDSDSASIIEKLKKKIEQMEPLQEALKKKIEQMQPLHDIGQLVRGRKMETCIPKGTAYVNKEVVKLGYDVAFNGQALADATMCLESAVKKYGAPIQYENRYGAAPQYVWDNRHFTMLLELLDMKLAVKYDYDGKFAPCQASFKSLYEKIITNLLAPGTTITSNQGLMANQELYGIFKALRTIFNNAKMAKGRRASPPAGAVRNGGNSGKAPFRQSSPQ